MKLNSKVPLYDVLRMVACMYVVMIKSWCFITGYSSCDSGKYNITSQKGMWRIQWYSCQKMLTVDFGNGNH